MEGGDNGSAPARHGDLPVRIASAVVMLALVGGALGWGGDVLRGLIVLVALACFIEFLLLVVRATRNIAFRLAAMLGGAVYIGLAAAALLGFDPMEILTVLGIVVFTDTGAYFFGRAIGGPKIAPAISPSKTWAGLFGGMVAAAGWAVAACAMFARMGDTAIAPDSMVRWALAGAALAVLAQMGDFFESWLKRRAGVKDSSPLIPGHGGIFDRIDGLLPVAIAVGLGMAFL